MTRNIERRLRALEGIQPKTLTAWAHVAELTDEDRSFISAYCNRMLDTDDEATPDERGRLAAILERITCPDLPAGAVSLDWIAYAR